MKFKLTNDLSYSWKTKLLYEEDSPYQNIKIIKNKTFGKALLLDNNVMFSEYDEHIYHELITKDLKLLNHFNNALIIGGGDCLTAKRVLKYPFSKVFQIEIDKRVTKISSKYFPHLLKKTLKNKHLKIIYNDAFFYLKNINKKFNFIVLDLTDPKDNNPLSNVLYSKYFYKLCKSHMTSDSIIVIQIGCPFLFKKHFNQQVKILSKLFKYTKIYGQYMHCYGMHQYFISCSDSINLECNEK